MNALRDAGWESIRVPTSGSGTEAELPDVHAGASEHGFSVAIEAKRTADTRAYIDREEAMKLIKFAWDFGSIPAASGRYDDDTTQYIEHIDRLPRTPSGNISLHQNQLQESDCVTPEDMERLQLRSYPELVCPACEEPLPNAVMASPEVAMELGYTKICSECADLLSPDYLD